MLAFYPEFESGQVEDPEIVFLLDCSNSMKGEAIRDARKVGQTLQLRVRV